MGLTLIASKTAPTDADSGEIRFADGEDSVVFDNTYKEYQFYFVNIHPETNGKDFEFQVNDTDDPAGGFDVSEIVSTHTRAYHAEDASGGSVAYRSGADLANEAEYQLLQEYVGATDGTADDSGVSGVLTIYDPSSAYIKHFTARTTGMYDVTSSYDGLTAGYINDVTPIDEINFRMSADAIDTGTIYMYGVS